MTLTGVVLGWAMMTLTGVVLDWAMMTLTGMMLDWAMMTLTGMMLDWVTTSAMVGRKACQFDCPTSTPSSVLCCHCTTVMWAGVPTSWSSQQLPLGY